MKISINVFIACFVLFGSTSVFAQKSNFRVVGYFTSWNDSGNEVNVNNLDVSKLTHINWAFKIPDSTGNFPGVDRDMPKLVEKAHAANVKVLVSLGGGSGSGGKNRANWFNLISTPEKRAAFIHNIAEYVKKNNLQGVDVDYEGGAINANYDPFIKQLSDTLKPKGLLLTAALNGDADDKFQNSTLPYFDWINIMSYDATGTWTPNNPGQHASYDYAVKGMDMWMARGARKDQIVLGVPFYAHAFKTDIKYDDKNYVVLTKAFPDAYMKDELGDFVFHNGIPTIQKKTSLAMDKGAGIMIWAVNYDTIDEHSLLKAIDDVVKKK